MELENALNRDNRTEFLPTYKSSLGDDEAAELVDTVHSAQLGTGTRVTRFEHDFSDYTGSKHSVAVSSAPAGVLTAFLAHGIKAGDEIALSTVSPPYILSILEELGAMPILVDIDPETTNIDVNQLEMSLTPRTRAIYVYHNSGFSCEMDGVMDIAMRYGLFVLEDGTEAIGGLYKNVKIGSFGHASVFGFGPQSLLTTGDGGMITTNDAELAANARVISTLGIRAAAWKRSVMCAPENLEVHEKGYPFNMTDLQAAVGICQLRKLDIAVRLNNRHATMYNNAFTGMSGINLPSIPSYPNSRMTWSKYEIRLGDGETKPNRMWFVEGMRRRNINVSIPQTPIHMHTFYVNNFGRLKGNYTYAEDYCSQSVRLPLYPSMANKDIVDVIEAVAQTIGAPIPDMVLT